MHNKLAIVITHPVQYYVPLFKSLATKCDLKVFYSWGAAGATAKYDPDFKKKITWDLPLLEGYSYELLANSSTNPGSHHGKGIVNPDLIEKIAAFAPDAILVYGYIYHSHFKVMRHFKGKTPIWFRGDSTLLDSLPWYKAIAKKIYLSWVYRFVNNAFYVGTANKAYFKQFGLKENQLIFAPHAIDNERFAISRKAEAEDLRKKLDINPEEILILFAGKLEPKKNPKLLLRAFLELNLPNTHLLFVGNGILEAELKIGQILQQAQDDTKHKIHFMDFQNQTQMPVAYQACDLFCLPSKGPGETWGLAVNEAMASGKAILVSDKVGCGVDLVENENNGYIFESENLIDLVTKLKLLTEDKQKLVKMGEKSALIIKNWSIEKQSEAMLKELNN